MTRRGLMLAACIAGALTMAAPVAAQELRFAHWLPAQHPLAKLGFEPWAKSLADATKGALKVTLYPAQQLGKAADHYDMASTGIADMTWVSPGYQASRFPVFAASELPMMIAAPGPGSAAVDAWYRKLAEREMKDVKFCFAHVHVGTLHSSKAITEPSQIKGMKIRPANGTVAQTMTLLGATNVQVSAPEARDALEKGVADAITFPWNSLITFGIDKVTKFHMDTRLYAASFVWVLNKAWYDGLKPDMKKAVDDHCNNAWAEKVGTAWGDDEDSGRAKLQAAGHTITPLSPEQINAWRQAVAPITEKWAADAKKAGVEPPQTLEALKAELKSRNGLY